HVTLRGLRFTAIDSVEPSKFRVFRDLASRSGNCNAGARRGDADERRSGAALGARPGARPRPSGARLPENATDRCRSDRRLTSHIRLEQAAACTTLALVVRDWIDRNLLALTREMRLSYLPPLMVYVAAGISGLTAIVGTFFVKERLGLSAEFLAALGFWAGLPWALKVPLGHLVDLIWRWKAALVFVGAGLIAAGGAGMIGLLGPPKSMRAWASLETWFVAGALLAPIGYVVQDVVADAMTVEAVPRFDADGRPVGMGGGR